MFLKAAICSISTMSDLVEMRFSIRTRFVIFG
jgi:hypothetical protein